MYDAREALIAEVVGKDPAEHRRFLLSFKADEPEWDLLGGLSRQRRRQYVPSLSPSRFGKLFCTAVSISRVSILLVSVVAQRGAGKIKESIVREEPAADQGVQLISSDAGNATAVNSRSAPPHADDGAVAGGVRINASSSARQSITLSETVTNLERLPSMRVRIP